MDDTQKQSLQLFLLLALNAAGEIGLALELLLPRARLEVMRELTLPQIETVLRGMADQRHVQAYGTALGQQRWKITGLGRAALQEAGQL